MGESDDGERLGVIEFLLASCATRGHCLVKVFVASRPVVGLGGHSAGNHKLISLQDVNKSDISKLAESSQSSTFRLVVLSGQKNT